MEEIKMNYKIELGKPKGFFQLRRGDLFVDALNTQVYKIAQTRRRTFLHGHRFVVIERLHSNSAVLQTRFKRLYQEQWERLCSKDPQIHHKLNLIFPSAKKKKSTVKKRK